MASRARAIASGMASISLTMALVAGGLVGCSGGPGSGQDGASASNAEETQPGASGGSEAAVVTGSIRGTSVRLDSSELDDITLAIHEGDGWGFNPSLLIFLFLDDGEDPSGRSFKVTPGETESQDTVHVHYRWRDPETDEIHTEMVTSDFELELKLGEIEDDQLTGSIVFATPGEDTRVSGAFEAKVSLSSKTGPEA